MITLGLVGVGRWGANILRTLGVIPGCQVRYVCDSDVGRAQQVLSSLTSLRVSRERAGMSLVVLSDYRELLVKKDLDAVLIANPGSAHATTALSFIAKGIPTFIEKPMTTRLQDALKLKRAADKSGALVFVGYVHLYNTAYLKAKSLVRRAGKLRWLLFEGMNNGPYRDDMSALWDWAPHDVAMALDLLGEMPRFVQAWGLSLLRPHTKLYDAAVVKLVFSKDISAIMTVSWLAPEKRKKAVVVGSNDAIVFDDTLQHKVALYRGMGPTFADVSTFTAVAADRLTRELAIVHQTPRILYPRYSAMPPLEAELRAFIRAVRTGQQPPTDIDSGVNVVRIIAAAEDSIARGGKTVEL